MENKKIGLSFGIVAVAFLVIIYMLVKDFNNRRANDYADYVASITNLVKQKNDKIKIIARRLAVEQKENEDLKNTLADTRNNLDALSKKLAQSAAPVVAPASASIVTTTKN